ncbi:MAG: hypothetical protein PHS37_10125 [Candidatus Omnitrophica bacterium]|nr:hypothetical protein [Candidatus Omnitrophota bacterium]
MQDKKIRILNFDDSITAQRGLLSRYEHEIITMTDIGPRARFWVNSKVRKEIAGRIGNTDKRCVTFIGSGDFHHITDILLAGYDEPIAVIHFDFHQDWDSVCPLLHCGSWVSKALRRENILKCVNIGASAKKMEFFSLQAGDMGLLRDDRLELYPYISKPGMVFMKHVPSNNSINIKGYPFMTVINWKELKGRDLSEFTKHMVERLPAKKVYVTVDKDCMNEASALTNWDQGEMSVDDVCVILKQIKEHCDIVGMDINGDYSPVRTDTAFKDIMLRWNHPGKIAASRYSASEISAVNETTNMKILETIMQ